MEKSSEKEFIKATVISPTKIQQNVVRLQSHNKNHSMQRTAPPAQNDLAPNASSTPNVNSANAENFALELTCGLVFVKHWK